MVYLVGVQNPHVAIGTSALAVAANAASASFNHARRGNCPMALRLDLCRCWHHRRFLGSTAGKAFDGQRLLFLFAIVMIVVGILMLRRRGMRALPMRMRSARSGQSSRLWSRHRRLLRFLRNGGRVPDRPGLIASTEMAMINAVGTSLVASPAFGLTTALNYALSGLVDWVLAAVFIVGGITGSLPGRAAKRLSGAAISRPSSRR